MLDKHVNNISNIIYPSLGHEDLLLCDSFNLYVGRYIYGVRLGV